MQTSADFLGEHMGEVPVLVIACSAGGRADGLPAMVAASMLGNILPATWSFMLAARARGLGTAWTTVHLMMEQQVADIVGIPFDQVQQVCLIPLAHTVGTDFHPAHAARPRHDHPLGRLVAAPSTPRRQRAALATSRRRGRGGSTPGTARGPGATWRTCRGCAAGRRGSR